MKSELSPETLALAASPFMRPGGKDFDCAYACAVWDARERVELEQLERANPGKNVVTRSGRMGIVVHPTPAASTRSSR